MIELLDVRKRFGPIQVLNGVDLSIQDGRITAVIGPNGSGKTTLIKMILGLVRPDHGSIKVGGIVVNGDSSYRHLIGYMPQIVRFPGNLTGSEIMQLLRDLRDDETKGDVELIRAFDLEQELGRPFRTLSGGTRQKVNAAIAFRFGAPLMILDEPTAGLDPVACETLKAKMLAERDGGRSFLVTSHDMAHLDAVADDVAFLLDGEVRFFGSVADLKRFTGAKHLQGAIATLMKREAA